MLSTRAFVHWVTLAASVTVASTVTAGILTAGDAFAGVAPPRSSASAPRSPASTHAADAEPVPAEPSGLPSDIEDPTPYVPQVACDPVSRPGTLALGDLLRATYPGTSYAAAYPCGTDGPVSEHYEGRALDWFTSVRDPQGAARAQAFLDWLLAPDAAGHAFANARRLGVMYVIWDNRIWGAYAAAAGWRAYSTCAAHPESSWDTACHRDHIHISLSWAGAMERTSFWSHRVAPVDYGPCRTADLNWAPPYSGFNGQPCPDYSSIAAPAGASATVAALVRYSGATVGPGSTGPVVTAVQQGLGLTADGRFGDGTGAAVSAFRTAHGLTAGTTVNASTWRALLSAAGSSSGSSGSSGSSTGSSGSSSGTSAGSSGSGGSSAGSGVPGAAALVGLTYGSRGAAVTALQQALHVSPVSGWYGPVTRAAVIAFQRAHHLPTTGSVGPATAAALMV